MNKLLVILLLALSVLSARAAEAEEIFEQGHTHFSLVAGNGYAFDDDYFVLGVSASYFLLDGLSIGGSFENWSGGDPSINKYTPFVQYVFYQAPSMRPYIGGFYRHTDIDTLSDIKSYGGRAGIYIASGHNAYVSAGIVYESYIDCEETIYLTCSETYPEIGFTIGF
jgi:hypothetical protein